MIDYIFYWCVDFLAALAKATGTTYELINMVDNLKTTIRKRITMIKIDMFDLNELAI